MADEYIDFLQSLTFYFESTFPYSFPIRYFLVSFNLSPNIDMAVLSLSTTCKHSCGYILLMSSRGSFSLPKWTLIYLWYFGSNLLLISFGFLNLILLVTLYGQISLFQLSQPANSDKCDLKRFDGISLLELRWLNKIRADICMNLV